MEYISHYNSPLGPVTMAGDEENLKGLWFDGQKYDRLFLKNKKFEEKETEVFALTKQWLDEYFSGKIPEFIPPLKIEGSVFKQTVGKIMLSIPYGKTMSYGEIAVKAGEVLGKKKMSAQAVGGAVGHNFISIIIPCHRVLSCDKKLTGYAGGTDRKKYLLNLEGISFKE